MKKKVDDRLCCKSFAGDKHVSLFRKFVNYGQKKFYKIGPRRQLYETGVNLPTLSSKLDHYIMEQNALKIVNNC